MKTDLVSFTVRDLNRQPAKVLAACDEEGEVEIRTREGRTYSLKAKTVPEKKGIKLPDFEEMRRKMHEAGFRGTSDPEEIERINRIIAGEE